MTYDAESVADYVSQLPDDRRAPSHRSLPRNEERPSSLVFHVEDDRERDDRARSSNRGS